MDPLVSAIANTTSKLMDRKQESSFTRSTTHIYRARRFAPCLLAFLFLAVGLPHAVSQTIAADITSADLWKPAHVPFSFIYDGKKSAQLLSNWQISQEDIADEKGKIHRTTYTDPGTHLKVMADVRLYPDFPGVIDWVLRFRNDGTSDTPIIENILPLDWSIPASAGDCVLRHARGSNNAATDFTPLEENFGPGGNDHLESSKGRSSDTNTLPFFNLQTGDHGLIGAIGWTGNWKADFTYAEDGKTIVMASGMKADASAASSGRGDSYTAHRAHELDRRQLARVAKQLAASSLRALYAAGQRPAL